MTDFGVLQPAKLYLLLAIPLVWWLLQRFALVKAGYLKQLGATTLDVGGSHLSCLAILSLGILALSRPYWGVEKVPIKSTGRDFMVVMDIS
ncbi:MAG: hypothetical protein KDD42_10130, partial [Bdellovibrionales bacterium]|nr:hypothetical protein [Bdellovibrionales bacterium]